MDMVRSGLEKDQFGFGGWHEIAHASLGTDECVWSVQVQLAHTPNSSRIQ